jgi:hypothetical protein
MSKLLFWLTVVGVAILGIWGFKTLAGMTNSSGLKKFASAV